MRFRGETTLDTPNKRRREIDDVDEQRLSLVVIWAPEEPDRLGEVLIPEDGVIFGRGPTDDDGDEKRLGFLRQRPGRNLHAAQIDNPFLSRRHLKFSVSADALEIEVLGKKPLRVGDTELQSATVREGDVVEISGLYAFYCTRRTTPLPEGAIELAPEVFGRADAHGIVGESAAVWTLRTHIAFLGKRNAHALITGASGTGKELVAQAIHRLSSRSKKEIVSRNAATFPSGLIDAELFGNLANYPNVGMPERAGIIGQADGSTLFLDEIGELPTEMQAHLLRVLDGGEYQRLGDAKKRFANIRLVAATNRAVEELKEDLAARLGLRVHVPGLDERREDIALLARHLLTRTAAGDPAFAERFFEGSEPRVSSDLIAALVTHQFSTHIRELSNLLMRSAATSRHNELDLTKEVKALIKPVVRPSSKELTAEEIKQALQRHGGVKDKAWRELGLPSRHALHRLMKKLEIPD